MSVILRALHMGNDVLIRVENSEERYRIRHQLSERCTALRD